MGFGGGMKGAAGALAGKRSQDTFARDFGLPAVYYRHCVQPYLRRSLRAGLEAYAQQQQQPQQPCSRKRRRASYKPGRHLRLYCNGLTGIETGHLLQAPDADGQQQQQLSMLLVCGALYEELPPGAAAAAAAAADAAEPMYQLLEVLRPMTVPIADNSSSSRSTSSTSGSTSTSSSSSSDAFDLHFSTDLARHTFAHPPPASSSAAPAAAAAPLPPRDPVLVAVLHAFAVRHGDAPANLHHFLASLAAPSLPPARRRCRRDALAQCALAACPEARSGGAGGGGSGGFVSADFRQCRELLRRADAAAELRIAVPRDGRVRGACAFDARSRAVPAAAAAAGGDSGGGGGGGAPGSSRKKHKGGGKGGGSARHGGSGSSSGADANGSAIHKARGGASNGGAEGSDVHAAAAADGLRGGSKGGGGGGDGHRAAPERSARNAWLMQLAAGRASPLDMDCIALSGWYTVPLHAVPPPPCNGGSEAAAAACAALPPPSPLSAATAVVNVSWTLDAPAEHCCGPENQEHSWRRAAPPPRIGAQPPATAAAAAAVYYHLVPGARDRRYSVAAAPVAVPMGHHTCIWCGLTLGGARAAPLLLAHLRASHALFAYSAVVAARGGGGGGDDDMEVEVEVQEGAEGAAAALHVLVKRAWRDDDDGGSGISARQQRRRNAQRALPFAWCRRAAAAADVRKRRRRRGWEGPVLPALGPIPSAAVAPRGGQRDLKLVLDARAGGKGYAAHGAGMYGAAKGEGRQGAWVPHRQYYHSRTCVPMREDEMDIDSDDDVDSSWLLQQNARLIDEYEDVSAEEKAFMKLWNMHTRAFETPSDSSVPLSCAVFARRFAPALLQRGLRANFVLHLFNLWDNCLVSPKHIHACMAIVNNAEQRLLRTDGGGGGGGAGA